MERVNLKDVWYRICDAQNRSTCKQSTTILLRNFYVGVTTWYRFVLDTITGGNFLSSHTLDAFNAMGNLVGSPPIKVNETKITLEHLMQRLDTIENKMPTNQQLEELDKKMHNQITKLGSTVGNALKLLKEKEPLTDRIEQSPARIDKLEEVIDVLGSDFSSIKTSEDTSNLKFTYVSKVPRPNLSASSSREKGDLKMISVHPTFRKIKKEPIFDTKILDFVPRSVMINIMFANPPRKSSCHIEELNDDKT